MKVDQDVYLLINEFKPDLIRKDLELFSNDKW